MHDLCFVQIMFAWDSNKCQRSVPSPVPEVSVLLNKSAWTVEAALPVQLSLPLRAYNIRGRPVFTSVATGGRKGSRRRHGKEREHRPVSPKLPLPNTHAGRVAKESVEGRKLVKHSLCWEEAVLSRSFPVELRSNNLKSSRPVLWLQC